MSMRVKVITKPVSTVVTRLGVGKSGDGSIINEISRSLPDGRLRGFFAFDYILVGLILH